jgi:tetratricopeptide (TPR) repeat protein
VIHYQLKILSILVALTCCCQHVSAQKTTGNLFHSVKTEKTDALIDSAYAILNSDPGTSLEYSQRALYQSKQANYSEGQINSLLLSGMVYKKIGAFDKSADAYFQALRIAESKNNQVKVSSCYNNIGNIYQAQNNFEKALNYYNLSLRIEEKLNNKPQISIRLYNIGALYESLDSLDRALTYYYNSLLIEEEIKNKEGILYALYGIAGVETRLKRFDNALENLNRALKTAKEMDDISGLTLVYHEFGKYYMAKGEHDKSVQALKSGIEFAKQAQLKNELMVLYLDLATNYRRLGRNEEAYQYLESHLRLKDTLSGIEIQGKVADLETRFQVEKKQKEIQYLKNLNDIKSKMADTERRSRNFLLITIVMIIILSVINLRRVAPDTRSIVQISLAALAGLLLLAFIVSLFSLPLSWQAYFSSFRDVVMYSVPFLFIGIFVAERILMKQYLTRAADYTRQIQDIHPAASEKIITLRFEGKDAAVSIPLKDVLCIEAADNYIALYYFLNAVVKKELFRSTMKMAEEQLAGNDEMIRCHKSYIINTNNVAQVSGNAQGYRLLIKGLEFSIPVSRTFPKSLINKLKKNS